MISRWERRSGYLPSHGAGVIHTIKTPGALSPSATHLLACPLLGSGLLDLNADDRGEMNDDPVVVAVQNRNELVGRRAVRAGVLGGRMTD